MKKTDIKDQRILLGHRVCDNCEHNKDTSNGTFCVIHAEVGTGIVLSAGRL
jgi:hypothetical protein